MNLDILTAQKEPIFFVTNDPVRAIGLENVLPNFHIICLDDTPLVDLLRKAGISVFCLERELGEKNILRRSSGLILEHPKTQAFIKEKAGNEVPNILFFKPQKKIEVLARKFGFKLLGNSAELNQIFEDKINFFELFKTADYFPYSEIHTLDSIDFSETENRFGLPFVLQFGFGWAGNTTFFIDSLDDLQKIQQKFGKIKIKVSRFIEGITVLNNAVVAEKRVLQSSPAIQIKSDKLLTSNRGGTGGRQWPAKISPEQKDRIKLITENVGRVMNSRGYKGFFGLDFLIEEKTKNVFLSENNARLTASCPFWTKLELQNGGFPLLGDHVMAFLQSGFSFPETSGTIDISGGEAVVKNTNNVPVTVTSGLKTGIYDKNGQFKREEYFLRTADKNEFWLSAAGQGRTVNPETEILRINSLSEICDGQGTLSPVFAEILTRAVQSLHLQK